jgi:type VI secretion system secreted protein Hcp
MTGLRNLKNRCRGARVIPLSVLAVLVSLHAVGESASADPSPDDVLVAVDMFIKFDAVEGEARDEAHQGWSDLASFSQSFAVPAAPTGATRRRAGVTAGFTVTKSFDAASPKLAEACTQGKVFPKVEIHLTGSYGDTRQPYLVYELQNVMVTSYRVSSGEDVPMEELTLNFEQIKTRYMPQDPSGAVGGVVEHTWSARARR